MAILTTTQAGLNFVGGTTFIQTGATTLMAIATNGNIQFSQYGAGTLVTDASGNITVSSGGGAGGPYLPLSAGSTVPLSGDLYLNDSKFVRFTTTGGSNGNASIDFSTGAAFSFVSNSSYAPMVFKTSSTERMRILANGNVGIGLTAPLQKLHVDGSTQLGRNGNNTAGDPQKTLISGQGIEDATTGNFYGSYGFLELNANNNYTGSARRIAITNGLLSNRFAIIRSDTNLGPMQLGVGGAVPTGAVADFVIDTSGNVGIGTTDPVNNLNVNGDIGYIGVIGQGSIYGNTGNSSYANMQLYSPSTGYSTFNNQSYGYYFLTGGSTKMTILNNGNVGINSTSPPSLLDVQPTSANRKVTRIANDVMSTYFYNTQADAILAWTCGSYYQAEVVITANQTNGGTTANLYIRGIWSNNHTSHHWDELEHIGSLPGSTITMSVGQNGSTTNSGRLELDFDYINGSFAQLNVRVTDFYGSHSYTIT